MKVIVVQVKQPRPQMNGLDYEEKPFEEPEYADVFLSKQTPGTQYRYAGESKWRTIPETNEADK